MKIVETIRIGIGSAIISVAVLLFLNFGTFVTPSYASYFATMQRAAFIVWNLQDKPELGESIPPNAIPVSDLPDLVLSTLPFRDILGNDLIDPWGNPYFIRRLTGSEFAFGIFSNGRDGITNTFGEDEDDLNSWNKKRNPYYLRMFQRSALMFEFGLFTLIFALVFGTRVSVSGVQRAIYSEQSVSPNEKQRDKPAVS